MKKYNSKLSKFVFTFVVLVGIAVIQAIFIVVSGWFSVCPHSGADVLVVLGNRVYPNGKMSPVLRYRVDAALQAYEHGCAPYIIASGGVGKEGHPEGTVMAEYLISKGVPADRVIVDNKGINSHMTAVNTRRIADQHGFNYVVVVTSYYHVFRSQLAMKQEDFQNVYGIGSHYLAFQDIVKIPRDLAGVYAYLLKY